MEAAVAEADLHHPFAVPPIPRDTGNAGLFAFGMADGRPGRENRARRVWELPQRIAWSISCMGRIAPE
jgi:hypothetical protein